MKLLLLLSCAVCAFCISIKRQKSQGRVDIQELHSLPESKVRQRRATVSCDDTKSILTEAENKLVVDLHNRYRRQENAADEHKLSFDQTLANRAQQWADKCTWDHGMTTDCNGNKIGQNMFLRGGGTTQYSKLNITFYAESWYKEKKNYNPTDESCTPGKKCGHYRQVAWASSRQVGCAYTKCPVVTVEGSLPWKRAIVFVCNYSPGSLGAGRVNTPGVPCSRCGRVAEKGYKCDNKLCAPCTPKTDGAACTCETKKCVMGTWMPTDCFCKCKTTRLGEPMWGGTLCLQKIGCWDAYGGKWCPSVADKCKVKKYEPFMRQTCPKTCKFC